MQAIFEHIRTELQGLYPAEEIRSFSLLILEAVSAYSRAQLLSNKNIDLSHTKQQEIQTIIARLKNFEPIQYILGTTEFYDCTFLVNENVLIPRSETEELVDWILKEHRDCRSLLDIGTGSGCIAVSLAKHLPLCKVSAFDISDNALNVAMENARRNAVTVDFRKVDILQPLVSDEQWDVIVSNPPYVCEAEKAQIHANVLEHEPHLALFVPDNDPLLFYRAIAAFAQQHLSENGCLYLEINRALGQETLALLREFGFTHVELRKDLSGNDRMIKACR